MSGTNIHVRTNSVMPEVDLAPIMLAIAFNISLDGEGLAITEDRITEIVWSFDGVTYGWTLDRVHEEMTRRGMVCTDLPSAKRPRVGIPQDALWYVNADAWQKCMDEGWVGADGKM